MNLKGKRLILTKIQTSTKILAWGLIVGKGSIFIVPKVRFRAETVSPLI